MDDSKKAGWGPLGQRSLEAVEKAGMFIGFGCVTFLMVANAFDALLRHLADKPLRGVLEISEVLLVPIVFLALSSVEAEKRHIRVPVILDHLPPRAHKWAEILNNVLGLSLMVVVVWQGWYQTLTDWRIGNYAMGAINIPLTPFRVLVPLGALLFSIRFLVGLSRQIHGLRRRPTQ